MKMIKTPQTIDSIKATLKRFDEEEVALRIEFSKYPQKMHKIYLKRAQAMGRLKKVEGLRHE